MSNVIVISGSLGHPIVAGTPLTNGPNFPIKYFLLAYDPSIDPDIHTLDTITSAVPFVSAAQSGDSSLIQRGGHYIFKDTDNYEISTQQFLILNGAEVQIETEKISGSDKSHSTVISLYNGKPLMNVISGTSPTDLYAVAPLGTWHSSQTLANKIIADTTTNSLSADSDNYFEVAGYSPILTSAGIGTEGLLRGVYKCRVGSAYGNFKFNKIGLYMESVGNPPVLVAVALLNTAIAKNKTGSSITSVEFDIEIQFHTEGTFANVIYSNDDYWHKIPDLSGYGLYTDLNVAIGASGTGWLPKAKLELTTKGENPALCLNKNYNENYMFIDVNQNADITSPTTSGSTYLKFYTTAPNSGDISKFFVAMNYYNDESYVYKKNGIFTSLINYVSDYDLNGNGVYIAQATNIDQVKGFYSNIVNHIGTTSTKTYGFHSYISSTGSIPNCDKYGYYAKVEGTGKTLYGVYAEVTPNASVSGTYGVYSEVKNATTTGAIYAGYFKVPRKVFGYAIYADGDVLVNGCSEFVNQYDLTGIVKSIDINSYGAVSATSASIVGISSIVTKNNSATAIAGYFYAPLTTNNYALSADGYSYFNGRINVRGSSSSSLVVDVVGKSTFLGSVTIEGADLTVISKNVYAQNIIANGYFEGLEGGSASRPLDKTGFMCPVGTIVAWATATPPTGWIICNGQSISASTYAELRVALGNATVAPDYRGMFLRGLGSQTIGGVTYTSEGLATSGQMDALQDHQHSLRISSGSGSGDSKVDYNTGDSIDATNTITTTGRTSTETRPVNKSVNWIIKY